MQLSFGHYVENLLTARRLAGVGVLTQVSEILQLRFSGSRLGFAEYYNYRLFDRSLSRSQRRQFAGYRRERELDRLLNKDYWRANANDKLLFYSTLRGLGLPHPRILAVCHPSGRSFPGAEAVKHLNELRDFLATATFPLFVKPVHGSFGRGAASVQSYDSDSDALVLGNGEAWRLADAADVMLTPGSAGYVVQELVRPHPAIREMCRATASSVRVVVVVGEQGPRLFRAAWKIPVGQNMSDNFMHGASGNLLGCVDTHSGRICRVISGPGFQMELVTKHPDTQQALLGIEVPDWPAIRELCLAAATAYPGLRLQSWDIAIGETGPIVLEVNVEGSMDLHQLAGGAGILDDDLLDVVAFAERTRGASRT